MLPMHVRGANRMGLGVMVVSRWVIHAMDGMVRSTGLRHRVSATIRIWMMHMRVSWSKIRRRLHRCVMRMMTLGMSLRGVIRHSSWCRSLGTTTC